MAFPRSIPRASLWAWEAQPRRNSLALPLSHLCFFLLGMWEEGGKGSRRREGAEFSMSSCQNVISCVAQAGSLGRIN